MKKMFTLLCAALFGAAVYAQDAYNPAEHSAVVRGTKNMCAENWQDDNGPGEAMAYNSATGKWEITLGVSDTKTVEFKVVYDAEWYGNEEGGNVQFSVSEPSDAYITFDPQTFQIQVTGDKVQEASNAIEFVCAVGAEALFGASWDVTGNYGRMEEVDRGYYEFSIKGVAAGTYEFKFAANGGWALQWGASDVADLTDGSQQVCSTNNGGNFKIVLAKGATYDVTLTLDLMSDIPFASATITKAGEAEVTEDVYSIAGTFNEWSEKDATTEMVKGSDGMYTYTTSLPAGESKFKVVVNHDWSESYGQDGADVVVTLDEASYVTIVFDPETKTVSYVLGEPTAVQNITVTVQPQSIYTLAGQRVSKAVKGVYIIGGKKVLR